MPSGAPERKRIDFSSSRPIARWTLVCAVILIIVLLALLFGSRGVHPVLSVSAIVAALIAFCFVAWRSQHRRG